MTGKSKRLNKFIYIFWVVFLVILEIPTNYSTIEQFLHKPVISAMVTIAVGSLLVFIAHSHGTFFKQLSFINNQLVINFNIPQRAITPGQSMVFYNKTHCLGGALIN